MGSGRESEAAAAPVWISCDSAISQNTNIRNMRHMSDIQCIPFHCFFFEMNRRDKDRGEERDHKAVMEGSARVSVHWPLATAQGSPGQQHSEHQ